MFICLHIKNRILMSNVLLLKNHFRDIYFGIIFKRRGKENKKRKKMVDREKRGKGEQ